MSLVPLLAAALAAAPPPAAARPSAWDLELVPLKPDVWLIRRPEPLRQPVEPNVLVVVNERDVVVVDGGGIPRSAANAIALIRSITSKPVSTLVNTHWHGDHTLGNEVYRRTWPDVRIVAHPNTRRDMTGAPMKYVGRARKQLEPALADLRARDAKGELDDRRRRLIPDLELMLDEYERLTVTPPDLTVTDRLVLHRGGREIHVAHLGKGNTEGDLVVWLPQERILASGDLVVAPLPYGFGSFPREWIETLDRLAAFDFELLVPGHGEVQEDRTHLRRVQGLLRAVRAQAAKAVAEGKDLEATRKAVDLSALAAELTGGDPMRERLFDAWWKQPITRSAWLEAKGLPIVQGASDETG